MPNPERVDYRTAFASLLGSLGAGYLRTPIREHRVTCAICTTACAGYETCYPCREQRQMFGDQLADRVGFVTYAWLPHQTGRLMHGYKYDQAAEEHVRIVQLLAGSALLGHRTCPERLDGRTITRWTTVPSTRGRVGEHPLPAAIRRLVRGATYVPLATRHSHSPRIVRQDRFELLGAVPAGAHVLVVDDTWTSGSQTQSAALALRAAGASSVSVLALARWLEPQFGPTGDFIERRLRHAEPDLTVCPWTGGTCPGSK